MLYKIRELLAWYERFSCKGKEWKIYCWELALSSEPQIRKFHVVFGRLRQNIARKSVPHVQHDHFSSSNQSNHWFVAIWLTLPSSNLKFPITEFTRTRRWRNKRQRERHLKMQLRVSQLLKATMLAKCVLAILKLNWNPRFSGKIKLDICHHMLTSSTQLQNRSFHVVERTRMPSKQWKINEQGVQNYCFSLLNMQICEIIDAVHVVFA